MRNAHFSFMAGTAVALVLTAAANVSASPFNQDSSYSAPPSMRAPEQFGRAPTEGTTRGATPQRQFRPDARDYEPAAPRAQGPAQTNRNTRGPDSRAQDSRMQDARAQESEAQTTPYRAPVLTRPETTAAPIITAPVQPVQSVAPAPVPVAPSAATPAAVQPRAKSAEIDRTPAAAPIRPMMVEPVQRPEPASVEPAPRQAPAVAASSDRPSIPDQQVAERIKELVTGKRLERMFSRKNEHDAAIVAYTANRFQPLWLSNGSMNERARAAINHLRNIEADGMDPSDYPTPSFNAADAGGLADADLKLTATLLTYARHVLTGRVHFTRISPNIDYKDQFDAGEVMKQLVSSTNIERTLDALYPQQPAYKALKAKYAELRRGSESESRIPTGPVLRVGLVDKKGKEAFMTDQRVPMVREKLGVPAATEADRYDRPLADAVAKFQKAHGLKPDGQLNAATIDALNGPSRQKKMDAILATMERWRWMPRNLGLAHVVLNIPDYHLRVYKDGQQIWMTRVVVGKPTQATPLLTETMKYITVNPTWNVPQSIIYNELLPVYETTDPNVFDKMGLKVERGANGDIRVFQPPGERNALGRIRFNFPNKFLVYQHDTPEKYYFSHDKRAYSHGCMRVQDPFKYAEVMLSLGAPRGGYTQEAVQRMLGNEEKQLDFQHHIPVHITYQTAFVDDAGKLQIRDDIYGLDSKYLSIVRGSERSVADVKIDQPKDPNFQPTAEHKNRMQSAARGGNPFNLFEQLFR
jgi:murein L,D-transpeptidase YcbB/YkuD